MPLHTNVSPARRSSGGSQRTWLKPLSTALVMSFPTDAPPLVMSVAILVAADTTADVISPKICVTWAEARTAGLRRRRRCECMFSIVAGV